MRALPSTQSSHHTTSMKARFSNKSRHSVGHRVAFTTQASNTKEDRGYSGIDVAGHRPTSPRAWQIMSDTLRSNKIKFLTPNQLLAAVRSGNVLIDIRPANEYTIGRVPGAVNVEFFQLIEGWDVRRVARRATFAFFGILNGTEYNPNFVEEFKQAVPSTNANIILYCNIGGTLDPTGWLLFKSYYC